MKKLIAFFLIFALLLTTLSIAGCSKRTYVVEFDSNGGSRPASQLVDKWALAEEPAEPTRNGFRFDGWFIDEDCEQKFDFTTAINKDLTLFAKWTEIFTVRFFQTDGTLIYEAYMPRGEILYEPEVQKEGYVFIGWYTDENCVQEYEFNIAVTANESIYGKWAADTSKTWLVNFKQSDETLIDQQMVRGGNRISVPQEPTINGKIFIDWYADSYFENIFDFETIVTSDLVLYAKFMDITQSSSFQWVNLPDGTVEVKKFIGTETEVVIPSTYDGKTVSSIGSEAFSACSNLTTVIIPDGVTNIGFRAFFQCTALSDIIIPDSVTLVSSYAFYSCSALISVSIGNSVNIIGDSAFFGCSNLTSLEIPASVTNMGFCPFQKCVSLAYIFVDEENASYKSIDGDLYSKDGTVLFQYAIGKIATSFTIPDGVETVYTYAIGNCPYLNEIIIPDSVVGITSSALSNSKKLKNISAGEGNTEYKTIDGNLYSKDGTKLIKYAIGKTTSVFTIPSDVTYIYDNAFSYCSNLTGVNIPDSLTTIGSNAFYDCENLKSVTIPDSVTFVGTAAFYGCKNMIGVTISDNLLFLSNWVFAFCENLTNVVIPDRATGISDYAFYKCSSLISVNIPETVVGIGEYAFCDCPELTSIRIPEGMIYIGGYAFLRCSNLTINCKASSQPVNWNANWNYSNLPVVWEYKG